MRTSLLVVAAVLAATPAAPVAADPPPRPTVATRALMRELVSGRRAWAELVDPAAGVFDLAYVTGEFEGSIRWGRHWCGADFLQRVRRELREAIFHDEDFRCQNRGARATCTIGDIGEGATTRRFEFRVEPDGLVLESVSLVNAVYNPKDEARVLAALRRRAAANPCRS